jgi:hypothetical protein
MGKKIAFIVIMCLNFPMHAWSASLAYKPFDLIQPYLGAPDMMRQEYLSKAGDKVIYPDHSGYTFFPETCEGKCGGMITILIYTSPVTFIVPTDFQGSIPKEVQRIVNKKYPCSLNLSLYADKKIQSIGTQCMGSAHHDFARMLSVLVDTLGDH